MHKDGLYLYRHMLPPNVPNLAFVGSEINSWNNPLTAALQAGPYMHAQGSCRAVSYACAVSALHVQGWQRVYL